MMIIWILTTYSIIKGSQNFSPVHYRLDAVLHMVLLSLLYTVTDYFEYYITVLMHSLFCAHVHELPYSITKPS